MTKLPYACQLQVSGCPLCGLVFCETVRCPRCHTPQADPDRKAKENLVRSWALLIAAMIFYIPATVLPVMYTRLFGNGHESTIMAGIIDFWQVGSYGIAMLIFVASLVIPCLKFLSLSLLLITSQRQSRWAMRERTKLYRLTEFIGYWSMLDVFVVAIVASLVQYPAFSEAEPRSGILYFGLMVILTLLATLNYDPRLIWRGDAE